MSKEPQTARTSCVFCFFQRLLLSFLGQLSRFDSERIEQSYMALRAYMMEGQF
jgi:hypothetical protein